MLINLSNHPSSSWSDRQLKSAKKKFNSIVDVKFPEISPYATSKQVELKAHSYLKKLKKLLADSPHKNNAVHLMGEFSFFYSLSNLLKKSGIRVVVSTTNRIVEELEGKKIVTFNFIKFREL